jgi:flavin reductase (DIM6/NTAB) family NADH-FMN oxidoreductase RutF
MQVDPKKMNQMESHHMLRNLVMPRPIALVSTVNHEGLVNVAPFSFFGVVSVMPPMLGIAIGRKQGMEKDTLVNVRNTRELVVNLVTETMAEKMNIAAMDFPSTESEVEPSGFAILPSTIVRPPLIADSPAQMECKVSDILKFGQDKGAHDFLIAEVVMFHVRDELWKDGLPDCLGMNILGRLGDDYYSGIREPFEIKRLRYEEWLKKKSLV